MNQDAFTDTGPAAPRGTVPARRSRDDDLDRCASAGRPVGSHGRPARQRISVRAFSPTKASRASPSTVPPRAEGRARARARRRPSADRRRCRSPRSQPAPCLERAGRACLTDPTMCDQLDDAAGRIVEVDRHRVPVREVEHDLAGLPIGEELDAVAHPCQSWVEPIAGDEEREVVVRRAVGGAELERRLPPPRQCAPPPPSGSEARDDRRKTRRAPAGAARTRLGRRR